MSMAGDTVARFSAKVISPVLNVRCTMSFAFVAPVNGLTVIFKVRFNG